MPGSTLELAPTAKLSADGTSRVVLHGDASMITTPKQVKKLKKKFRVVQL
jgi:hypothetical protein